MLLRRSTIESGTQTQGGAVMSRPSQCRECGCYEACLQPNAIHCAEREEWRDALDRETEMERAQHDSEMHT